MNWLQMYDPLGHIAVSAFVAAIPLFILFIMLAVKRAPGHRAALFATGSAMVLAILVWRMPVTLAVNSTLMGAAFGLFPIIWIVLNTIWLYNMSVESGQFEIIRSSLARITDDRRLQAVFIAFAFGSFLEGTAGFGTPVAITAAMLVGLGFNPKYAAGICLIANTAPVAFGAIGIPIVVAAQVSDLDVMRISAIVGEQLALLSLIVPLWLCVLMSGWKRTTEVLPAVIFAGLCYSVSQYLVATKLGPYLPALIAAVVTIVGLGLFLRLWKPSAVFHFPDENVAPLETRAYSTGEILRAWMPYILLAGVVFLWGINPVKELLKPLDFNFAWPGLHDMVVKTAPVMTTDTPYGAIFKLSIGSAAGTAIFLACLLSALVVPNYGYGRAFACFAKTARQLRFPILTIALILGLAFIMNYSGMSSSLGLALTHTGTLFPFFAPLLGWIGVFLTGSDTSANALFGSLQRTTAQQIGVDPGLMVATNSSGGVCGKMMSPQSIAVATAATGMVGEEGSLFRFTVPHSIAMVLIVCTINFLQAYVLQWTVP